MSNVSVKYQNISKALFSHGLQGDIAYLRLPPSDIPMFIGKSVLVVFSKEDTLSPLRPKIERKRSGDEMLNQETVARQP